MAGMEGFTHDCNMEKLKKEDYLKSLLDSDFSDTECSLIWDFYVSHSFASSTAIPYSLKTYGWEATKSKVDGLVALENELARVANIDSFCVIRSKNISKTLKQMNLSQDQICVTHPRAVLTQKYTCASDENEKLTLTSNESRINAIFRHIRNSLAHVNTYFFPNGMCLFEDKEATKTTASILISRNTLIDWIFVVDKKGVMYKDSDCKLLNDGVQVT